VSVSECCKPDFVPVPRSGAVDVHLSRPRVRPPRRSGVRHTRNRWTGRPIPYFALHRNGFILPPLLPPERWALTSPFHPYPSTSAGRYIFC